MSQDSVLASPYHLFIDTLQKKKKEKYNPPLCYIAVCFNAEEEGLEKEGNIFHEYI